MKFAALVAVASLALSGAYAAPNDFTIVRDIQASLEKHEAMKATPEFYEAKKACYPDVGCFTTDGLMKHTGLLPFTPEKCGTKFYAYTPSNIHGENVVDPHNQASFSVVDAKKRLVIISHGFGNSHLTPELQTIKDSLLKFTNGEVGTVIVVDWQHGAKQPAYVEASTNTELVGRQIGFLINELKTHHGVNPKNVYLVGFSLGAQVSGFAGKFTQSQYHFKVARITGLDAAAPMFEGHPGSYLTKDDAEFVDGIHSSAGSNLLLGEIGFVSNYAHVDFFPNSGHHQPMCHNLLKIACNHYGSVLFYEASISGHSKCQFKASACADWNAFKAHHCTKTDQELGYWADKQPGRGKYWLETTGKYPFCA